VSQEHPGDEALSVLRGIWSAQRQTTADLDAPSTTGTTRVCKNMKDIGFGGMAGDGADGGSTAGPVGEDLRAAWRTKLEREGKLAPGASSVRDLVLGDED
jgi:hypothetical protein